MSELRLDPTTRAAWLVHGETDLGPQRRCYDCGCFWPLSVEFWLKRKRSSGSDRWLQPCRGCRSEQGRRCG